jgi:hypothetical protein
LMIKAVFEEAILRRKKPLHNTSILVVC